MKRFEAQKVYLVCLLILSVVMILPGCGKGVFGGGSWNKPVTTTVSSTVPANGATVVPIGNKLTVTFSEPMDPLTITTTTFTLRQGTTPVSGAVAYTGLTAVFTPPASGLTPSTVYTATITTGAKALSGNVLAANYTWSFTTGVALDTTAPTVTFTNPVNGATAVAVNKKISATFSEGMDPFTILSTTFTVTGPGVTPVSGTVTYSGVTAVFTPVSNLAANTIYTATITTGAKDLAVPGNALAANYTWSFTSGAAADTTKPSVISTDPVNGATSVGINKKISAAFSEGMDPLTVSTATFTVTGPGGTPITGAVILGPTTNIATFAPTSNLAASTVYTATITIGAKDLAGNALAVNKIWSFTTGTALDTTAPTVILVNPVDLATGVAINSAVNATFSETMDPLTLSAATFTVQASGPPVGPLLAGTVAYDPLTNIETFTPAANLAASTPYTATITTGTKDLAGNALAVNKVWTFTTGTGITQGAVALGLAGTFGTFGGSAGMTNTGTLTLINGDIGTIATGTASITGFHDTAGDIYTETPANIGPVNGKIYTCTNSTTGPTSASPNAAACAIATQSRLDAQAAYLALVAMPPGGASPNPGANLAGLTLAPGVYTAPGGSFIIEGGDLTLDAQGNANAVWVFQMATTLRVGGPGAAAPQSIILAGGAQAKNIFWQVGSFATINAAGGGTMEGTIISQAGASFSTVGNVNIVRLNGRVISLGASVTLVDTVINLP